MPLYVTMELGKEKYKTDSVAGGPQPKWNEECLLYGVPRSQQPRTHARRSAHAHTRACIHTHIHAHASSEIPASEVGKLELLLTIMHKDTFRSEVVGAAAVRCVFGRARPALHRLPRPLTSRLRTHGQLDPPGPRRRARLAAPHTKRCVPALCRHAAPCKCIPTPLASSHLGKPVPGELSFECVWMKGDDPTPLDAEHLAVAPDVQTSATPVPSIEVDESGGGPKGVRRKSKPARLNEWAGGWAGGRAGGSKKQDEGRGALTGV